MNWRRFSMPEITSVERIRTKLKELESHTDTVIEVKQKIESYHRNIESIMEQWETLKSLFREATKDISTSQTVWEQLGEEINTINDDSRTTNEHVKLELSKLNDTVKGIEISIIAATKEFYSEYEQKVKEYDRQINDEVDFTRKTKELVVETGSRLENLLKNVNDQLSNNITQWCAKEDEQINEHISEFEKNLMARINKILQEFRNAVQSEVANFEKKHEGKTLEFMNRHETILKNINMQMETFSRTSLTFNEKLNTTTVELSEKLNKTNSALQTSREWLMKYIEEKITKKQQETLNTVETKDKNLKNELESKYNKKIEELEVEIQQLKKRGVINKIFGTK